MSSEPVYADASALVKLLLDEPETAAIRRRLSVGTRLATSRVAIVEVSRATAIANASAEMARRTARLLDSCLLVGVTNELIEKARGLASPSLRTLDAVHLASALTIGAPRLVAYDRQLLTAAADQGLAVLHPGLEL
jgi:predicted nucleic acid-binding protein